MDLLEYLTEGHTWTYPLAVVLQFERATPPHGIFEDLPMAAMVNDPLWTIKYELLAYAGLVLLTLTGVLRYRHGALAAFVAVCIGYGAIRLVPEIMTAVPAVGHLVRYGCCFLLGVLAYRYRKHLIVSPWLLVPPVALVLALSATPLSSMAWYLLTAALVVVAGARSFGAMSLFARRTDISYGTYLYGWPLQQALIVTFPAISVSAHLPLSLALALTFGWFSWHMVERPSLALKTSLPRAGTGRRSAA